MARYATIASSYAPGVLLDRRLEPIDAALPGFRFLYCTEVVVRLLMGERALVGFDGVVINNYFFVSALEEGHALLPAVASPASGSWPAVRRLQFAA